MLLYILLIILGFCLLIGGANILVNGASSIAKKFHVSDLLIGLTIVAFGTSAPELIVNIISSIQGSNDLVIGNIIGSNIANILLILGLSASLRKIHLANSTIWKEIPFALLGAILLRILINDNLFVSNNISILGVGDGLILLSIFAIFLYYVIESARKNPSSITNDMSIMSRKKSISLVLMGLIGLSIGGYLVIENAVSIAQNIGWSEKLIGLTVIALGTSMPELVTSIVAVLKNKSSIAVGNLIGSNIFNTFFILGISALIHPLTGSTSYELDIIMHIFVHILLFMLLFMGEKHTLQKGQGAFFVLIYIGFVVYMAFTG